MFKILIIPAFVIQDFYIHPINRNNYFTIKINAEQVLKIPVRFFMIFHRFLLIFFSKNLKLSNQICIKFVTDIYFTNESSPFWTIVRQSTMFLKTYFNQIYVRIVVWHRLEQDSIMSFPDSFENFPLEEHFLQTIYIFRRTKLSSKDLSVFIWEKKGQINNPLQIFRIFLKLISSGKYVMVFIF
jgi:hypothetical protein